MKKLLCAFFITVLCLNLFSAEVGKIGGQVFIKDTDNSLENVNIIVKSNSKGTTTNKSGKFVLRDIPAGKQIVKFSLIGYKPVIKTINVIPDQTKMVEIYMEKQSIKLQKIVISENRATKRESPITFTEFSEKELKEKYTTQDMPELLEGTPGLFNSSAGIGESELSIRGFSADKVQVLINGIPVNDPESQKVYWSNWTGLSSSVKNVQVQKGAGSSMYGSGAFGGSVNIETMGSKAEQQFSLRSSLGMYSTSGKIADGDGGFDDSNPFNYNVLMKYDSGYFLDNKFSYTLTLERKAGSSYIVHTDYNGWSGNLETQSILGDHVVKASIVASPQEHHNTYMGSDKKLMETLGRSYNRDYHEYQRNYYFKPQLSLRDEWKINEFQVLKTNFFATYGRGGGQYLSNGMFNTETGKITYYDDFLNAADPAKDQAQQYGNHAHYVYETYGVILEGYDPGDGSAYSQRFLHPLYGEEIIPTQASEFFSQNYDDAWRNDSHSEHEQWGFNSYYNNDLSDQMDLTLGGEYRHWHGKHYKDRENLRIYDPTQPDSVREISSVEKQYDNDNYVNNMSFFSKIDYKPISKLHITADAQYAIYSSEVNEVGIHFYDYVLEEYIDETHYATKDELDDDGNKKFTDSDYEKTFDFFSPKFGANYNINKNLNVFANYSIAYKEPKTMQWYSGSYGPDGQQMYKTTVVDSSSGNYELLEIEKFYGELKPEQTNTYEFGLGYGSDNFSFDFTYYNTKYLDKIQEVYKKVAYQNVEMDSLGNEYVYNGEKTAKLTLNLGEAIHQGIELSTSYRLGQMDCLLTAAFTDNAWEEVVNAPGEGESGNPTPGATVLKSPEKQISGNIGYTFQELPFGDKLRIGLAGNWWEGFYASASNEYVKISAEKTYNDSTGLVNGYEVTSIDTVSSNIPHFLQIDANVKYDFTVSERDFSLKLDFNNILNREDNYEGAGIKTDYNRYYLNEETGEMEEDPWSGEEQLYLTPAPLFNVFMTLEVKF